AVEELGCAEEHIPKDQQECVSIFPESVPVGEAIEPFLNLHGTVLELDLPPNRADCLNMIGMAYEVAAILDKELNLPDEEVKTIENDVSQNIKVDVKNPDL